jgi:hypothetical protein
VETCARVVLFHWFQWCFSSVVLLLARTMPVGHSAHRKLTFRAFAGHFYGIRRGGRVSGRDLCLSSSLTSSGGRFEVGVVGDRTTSPNAHNRFDDPVRRGDAASGPA